MNFERTHEEKEGADLSPFKPGALGKKINEGSHTTVHKLNREEKPDLIVKIGETSEYTPPLLKALRLSFPRKPASRLFEKILGPEFKIYPDMDFIRNGLAEYALIKKYFGHNAESSEDDERKDLIRSLEDMGDPFYGEMSAIGINRERLRTLLNIIKKHSRDNFLPKEHLVVGHPPSLKQKDAEHMMAAGERLPSTYYIIQEPVEGEGVVPLYELSDYELAQHTQLLEKLLTFAVLAKRMYSDMGKLIDMRAEEVAKHPFEWFQQTSNALVNKKTDDLSFVDTRWLWDKKSKIGEGGINLIKHMGVRSVDRAINKYLELLLNG